MNLNQRYMNYKREVKTTMKCKNCGAEMPDINNFCTKCSSKLKDECNCWVLGVPYNCGERKCPGFGLRALLMQKTEKRWQTLENKVADLERRIQDQPKEIEAEISQKLYEQMGKSIRPHDPFGIRSGGQA